jgi:predicted ATP-binding protein involved in virulence
VEKLKINKLEIDNFRGIKKQELNLDGKSTVFFGMNGVGKSSILKVVNILFSKLIQKAIKNKYKNNIDIEVSDIMFGQSKAGLKVEFSLDEINEFSYKRSMERKDKKRTHTVKDIDRFGEIFYEKYVENEDENMPIFVNYGVHRVVLDVPLRIRKDHSFEKTSAFEKAIENKIDFRTFFEWFRNQEDYENQIKATSHLEYEDKTLKSVREAIYVILDGFSNLRVDRNPLRMVVNKGDKKLEINQLSDGEKCTLSLVGDLARRLALANPNLNNPLEGRGIALIDEIELHMHPTWQRRIIPTLTHLFPNIQFLITTHSPQVLGEVDQNMNIFELNNEDSIVESNRIKSLIGWDSNYILEDFMGTSAINLQTKGKISRMYELILDGKIKEAQIILQEIEELTDSANEEVVKGRMLIARKVRGI